MLRKVKQLSGGVLYDGEYLVLVQPHLQHDGRRKWVVMAVYDHDEVGLAANLASAYEERGYVAAVAQIILESDGDAATDA